MLNVAKIWQAARATSAASTFFDPIKFGDEGFVDGATGANNPISQLWTEAGDIWGGGASLKDSDIRCLVSIGTGIPTLAPFRSGAVQLGKALVAIATDTQQEANLFQTHHTKLYQDNKAFRFNVVRGLENVGLEDTSKWAEIKAATRDYIQTEQVLVQMKQCANNLRERDCMFN
jgi:predicted acylesterase/phospholipase RssA